VAAWSFRVTLADVDFSLADDADRVLTVCGDVALGQQAGCGLATFDRQAPTLSAAVGSALADLEAALPDSRLLRVEVVPPAGQRTAADEKAAALAALAARLQDDYPALAAGSPARIVAAARGYLDSGLRPLPELIGNVERIVRDELDRIRARR
jgi:hypothetical protein